MNSRCYCCWPRCILGAARASGHPWDGRGMRNAPLASVPVPVPVRRLGRWSGCRLGHLLSPWSRSPLSPPPPPPPPLLLRRRGGSASGAKRAAAAPAPRGAPTPAPCPATSSPARPARRWSGSSATARSAPCSSSACESRPVHLTGPG